MNILISIFFIKKIGRLFISLPINHLINIHFFNSFYTPLDNQNNNTEWYTHQFTYRFRNFSPVNIGAKQEKPPRNNRTNNNNSNHFLQPLFLLFDTIIISYLKRNVNRKFQKIQKIFFSDIKISIGITRNIFLFLILKYQKSLFR